MAYINSKNISWNPSTSDDVVGYRVRYKVADGNPIVYTDPYLVVGNTLVVAPNDFPSGTFDNDTDYTLGVSAVDDMGNESDIIELDTPLDFVPPQPPTGLTVS